MKIIVGKRIIKLKNVNCVISLDYLYQERKVPGSLILHIVSSSMMCIGTSHTLMSMCVT